MADAVADVFRPCAKRAGVHLFVLAVPEAGWADESIDESPHTADITRVAILAVCTWQWV